MERLQLALFRLSPDSYKGQLLTNGYLSGDYSDGTPNPAFVKRLVHTPGASSSLYKYLVGEYGEDGELRKGVGTDKVPEIVGKHLGPHWYTGPAKLLARTPVGRDYVVEKILERTLPKVNGSTDLARRFLAAGGQV